MALLGPERRRAIAGGGEPDRRHRDQPGRELRRLLFGLGIRFVGERAAQLLARRYRSLAALGAATVEEMEGIYEIGPVVAGAVREWFDPANRELRRAPR